MSTIGASGKDTSNFLAEIKQNKPSDNSSGSITSTAMDDICDRNVAIVARNKLREERRAIEDHEGVVSDNEESIPEKDVIEPERVERLEVEPEDEFTAIQNLSPTDFKKVISFSLKNAAEAAAAISSGKPNTPVSVNSSSKGVPFDRHAIVFKEADEVSGDVIPRQEIPDCIWKLVHAHVPLSLPCITTASIRYILNNPTSIKTTKSADGVSQSKELMLDMSTLSYFEIVFSVLTGFSVNFTLRKQAVGIYLGIYEDTHQSKGNMSAEVFDCGKIEMDIVCNLQLSQNNGT
jgi:hypothetical protein